MSIGSAINNKVIGLVAVSVLVVSPAFTAAATDGSTDINATVESTITIQTSGSVNVSLLPAGSNPVMSTALDSVKVSTNSTAGYSLQLTSSTGSELTSSEGTLNATAGSVEAPSNLSTNSWGFAIEGELPFGGGYTTLNSAPKAPTMWAAVPSSPVVVKNKAGTASADPTNVWYGVSVDSSQATGQYRGTVTYTATANE